MSERDENMIAALKRERAAYVTVGDEDRVGQVDEQLKHFGYKGEQDAVVDPTGGPAGRTTKAGRQRTAAEQPSRATASKDDPAKAAGK